jgi:hypothetical protein
VLTYIVLPFVITSVGTGFNNSYVAMSPAAANAVATFEAGKTPTNWNSKATGNLTEIANIVPAAQTIREQYPHLIYITTEAHPADFLAASKLTTAELTSPAHRALYNKLLADVGNNVRTLFAIDKLRPQLNFLSEYQHRLLRLQKAAAPTAAPRQWQHWLWVCFGCTAFFIPWAFLMKGRWSPRRARKDEREHRRFVEGELAKIRRELAPAGAGDIPELAPGPSAAPARRESLCGAHTQRTDRLN